jgi:hypothetical protein
VTGSPVPWRVHALRSVHVWPLPADLAGRGAAPAVPVRAAAEPDAAVKRRADPGCADRAPDPRRHGPRTDHVLAYFGWRRAYEDEAERAWGSSSAISTFPNIGGSERHRPAEQRLEPLHFRAPAGRAGSNRGSQHPLFAPVRFDAARPEVRSSQSVRFGHWCTSPVEVPKP